MKQGIWKQILSGLAAILLLHASSLAAGQDWQAIVKAAEKEGQVSIYGPTGTAVRNAFMQFSKAYPKIQLLYTGIGGAMSGPRVVGEQKAGIYTADLYIGGANTPITALLPGDALDPLKPALMLPEITDPSDWFEGRLRWIDPQQKYILQFASKITPAISYNTKLVNPAEFNSYHDLLNPKWKGKIIAWDPYKSGSGSGDYIFWYYSPDLGPAFVTKFFSQQQVAMSANSLQMANWLAEGRYAIGVGIDVGFIAQAKNQGLPVAVITKDLKEGAYMSSGHGTVSLLHNAPHPNAAKVYINWLLSKAGQEAVQEFAKLPSLRTDTVKDKLDPVSVPKKGVKYFMAKPEQLGLRPIQDAISKAMGGK